MESPMFARVKLRSKSMNKKMRFLRMPESEEKRAQGWGPDIQMLAMRAPVPRWRPSER